MGLALLFVIWVITLASSYFFYAKTWWLPTGASAAAAAIDQHFAVTFLLMGVVFLAAQLGLGLFVWRYRDRANRTASYTHGDVGLEALWTLLTAILFIGLALAGAKMWAASRFQPAGPGALKVEVTALQFQWYFRYPGPDGKYGATRPELEDASVGNPVGIDAADPASKDDFVTAEMYLPVNKQVDLILRSQDVIHSFFVPSMRFKQDAVPGLLIHMHFTPITIGDYDITCAELCGLGHYRMKAKMHVVSEQDFEKWQAAHEAEKTQ